MGGGDGACPAPAAPLSFAQPMVQLGRGRDSLEAGDGRGCCCGIGVPPKPPEARRLTWGWAGGCRVTLQGVPARFGY